MNVKYNFCFYIIAFLLPLGRLPAAMAVTTDELSGICEAMESAIVDISIEYEGYTIPPRTVEEAEKEMGMPMLVVKDGFGRYKLSAAGLLSNREPNEPLPERLLFERSTTVMNADGDAWDSVIKASLNGKIAKYLQIGGWPREVRSGGISYTKRFFMPTMTVTPVGFSVLRLSFSHSAIRRSLSARLRDKEFVHLDNTIENVNGFDTIRADFLSKTNDPNTNKRVYFRVYFSVDHGYTPILYEHMRGGKKVALAFEVHSLEQVAEGLWFPSSGLISDPDDERVSVFQTIGKIAVNQGLTEQHFDIDFPPGTEVRDEIRDLEYVVKPTEEQFKQ